VKFCLSSTISNYFCIIIIIIIIFYSVSMSIKIRFLNNSMPSFSVGPLRFQCRDELLVVKSFQSTIFVWRVFCHPVLCVVAGLCTFVREY
jgi:hypothetical protein